MWEAAGCGLHTVSYLVSITLTVYSHPREHGLIVTDPLDAEQEPHTTMHMTLRAGSASYARHCKIGAATKVASTYQMHYPKKCFSQEPSMYILHESHTLLF